MNARQAKEIVKIWVERNVEAWPGLRAAHLVGGITSLPDETPYPATKDVDIHLIFAEGSPALEPGGPLSGLLEIAHDGLSIEAGVKSVAEYASAEAVLANPEIAYHLTADSLLFDPSGWLRAMQEPVRREYRRRQWVLARLEHEREGLARARELLPAVRDAWGASGELNILGYMTTFFAGALAVATLGPPRMGGRMFVHMGGLLAQHKAGDLHEDILALLGARHATPQQAERLLRQGSDAFDLAVALPRTPHPFLPFEHKLHAHLRPYFVDACQAMIAAGCHREALPWISAFTLTAIDLILCIGPAAERPAFAALRADVLWALEFDTVEARAAKLEHVRFLGDQVFALAADIIAANPDVVD